MAEQIFSIDEINTGRQKEFDLLRAVAIFCMVLAHVSELWFSKYWEDLAFCQITPVSQGFLFISNMTGAFGFMFVMGASIVYSHNQSPKLWAKRGLMLIWAWFLLNAVRAFPLGYAFASVRGISILNFSCAALLISDILFFAGSFFIYFALLKKRGFSPCGIFLCSWLIFCVGHFLSYEHGSFMLQSILGNFIVTENSAFPFFNWIMAPTAGYCFGCVLRHCGNKKRLYGAIAIFCTAFWIMLIKFLTTERTFSSTFFNDVASVSIFYNANLLTVIASFMSLGMFLSLFYFIMYNVKAKWFQSVVFYLSSRLKEIYIVQWPLVAWTVVFIPRPTQPVPLSTVFGFSVIIIAISIVCVQLYERYIKSAG